MKSVISVYENRFGHIEVDLVSIRKKRKVLRYLDGLNTRHDPAESLIYLQTESDREAFLSNLTRAQREEMEEGSTVRALMDSWDLLAWVGHDAAENCKLAN